MSDAYPDTDDLPEDSTTPVNRPHRAAEETTAAAGGTAARTDFPTAQSAAGTGACL